MTKREQIESDDVTEEEILAMRNENIRKAEDLLNVIESVKVKQDAWQAVLTTAMVQEKEEEAAAAKLFRAVTNSQMKTFDDAAFKPWMDGKLQEGGEIGLGQLTTWYHDDALLQKTAFAGTVPFPSDLSETGKEELINAIDSTIQGPWFVENIPDLPLSATVDGLLNGNGDLQYLSTPFTSGAQLLDFLASPAGHLLRRALSPPTGTPCLMLNDANGPVGGATSERRLNPKVNAGVFRCIVIRGHPVVAEYAVKSVSGDFIGIPKEMREAVALRMKAFLEGILSSSVLFRRSVVVTLVGCGNNGTELNFFLHSVFPFDAVSSDCWTLEEVLLVAEYGDKLRDGGTDAPFLLRQLGEVHERLPVALGVVCSADSVTTTGAESSPSIGMLVAVAAGSAVIAAVGTAMFLKRRW